MKTEDKVRWILIFSITLTMGIIISKVFKTELLHELGTLFIGMGIFSFVFESLTITITKPEEVLK